MPISARHRPLFDDVILAKRMIHQKSLYNAIIALDRVLDELTNMETVLQYKKIEMKKEKKGDCALCNIG